MDLELITKIYIDVVIQVTLTVVLYQPSHLPQLYQWMCARRIYQEAIAVASGC